MSLSGDRLFSRSETNCLLLRMTATPAGEAEAPLAGGTMHCAPPPEPACFRVFLVCVAVGATLACTRRRVGKFADVAVCRVVASLCACSGVQLAARPPACAVYL